MSECESNSFALTVCTVFALAYVAFLFGLRAHDERLTRERAREHALMCATYPNLAATTTDEH